MANKHHFFHHKCTNPVSRYAQLVALRIETKFMKPNCCLIKFKILEKWGIDDMLILESCMNTKLQCQKHWLHNLLHFWTHFGDAEITFKSFMLTSNDVFLT